MTWSVVATVSEPEPLVMAFVAACLTRGASAVHLYLDSPQPGLEAALAGVARCHLIRCDAAYWRASPGGRPWPQSDRQRHNLKCAYEASSSDWMLNIDADEFLMGDGDPARALAALPEGCSFAQMRVAERVYLAMPDAHCIFDGVFRRPNPPELQAEVDRIDGDAARFLRQGMTGYPTGKGFFRVGRGLTVDLHSAKGLRPQRMVVLPDWQVQHFDGLTPKGWIWKKQRTMAQQPGWQNFAPERRAQCQAVADAGTDLAALERLYLSIKQLDAGRAAALSDLGLIVPGDVDVRADLARVFPGRTVDLSIAGFDAALLGYTRHRTHSALRSWFGRTRRRLWAGLGR